MKVVDILIEASEILQLNNAKLLLKTANLENETEILQNEEVESLFNLLKLSIRELCTNYAPVERIETFEITNNELKLADLINFIRIKSVKKGNSTVPYKILNRNLTVNENGKYEVSFYSYPEIETLFDEIDFLQKLNADVIVFGLCAYFCLSKGLFEDFHEMHDKYIERAECVKDLKIFTLPQRSWEWEQKSALKLNDLI